MRVLIVGVSKVGESLVKYICKEGHDVVVIDTNEAKIDMITDRYDCNGFVGNGTSVDMLKKAGIDSASLLVAVTKQDEVNILCACVAKKLGIKRTIAAVRNPEYKSEHPFLKTEMGIDTIVNPERLAAGEVSRMLRYPEGVRVEQFGHGDVRVASVPVKPGSILVDVPLAKLREVVDVQVLVCAIERKDKAVVPKGDAVLKEGDKLTVLAIGDAMHEFVEKIGLVEKTIKKVLVIGGSRIGRYLLEEMQEKGISVKLMECNQEKCQMLLSKYPKAHIVCGNALETEVLKKELVGMDACVTTTGNDDENLIISMFAKSFGIDRISAEIDNNNYAKMIRDSGMSHIFSTQDVSIAGVLRNARVLSRDTKEMEISSSIKWLYTFHEGRIEAAEFQIDKAFKNCGKQLMDPSFKLKNNVLIATISRDNEVMLATGSSTIENGDRIIVVSADKHLVDAVEILA